jgi:hypothetical protein
MGAARAPWTVTARGSSAPGATTAPPWPRRGWARPPPSHPHPRRRGSGRHRPHGERFSGSSATPAAAAPAAATAAAAPCAAREGGAQLAPTPPLFLLARAATAPSTPAAPRRAFNARPPSPRALPSRLFRRNARAVRQPPRTSRGLAHTRALTFPSPPQAFQIPSTKVFILAARRIRFSRRLQLITTTNRPRYLRAQRLCRRRLRGQRTNVVCGAQARPRLDTPPLPI